MIKKNPWIGVCPVCLMENKHLSTTKTDIGAVKWTTHKTCDHCSMVIGIEIDRAVKVLRADTYETRRLAKK